MKISSLLYHSLIKCRLCKWYLQPTDEIEWDHFQPIALGGAHDYKNIAAVHKACHAAKTRGTGATTAGSDIHKIAKVKRIQRKIAGTWKTNSAWPSPKMGSRPFRKRAKT
jgi:5-methylcytosine-specific restriction endonuclease McrA